MNLEHNSYSTPPPGRRDLALLQKRRRREGGSFGGRQGDGEGMVKSGGRNHGEVEKAERPDCADSSRMSAHGGATGVDSAGDVLPR